MWSAWSLPGSSMPFHMVPWTLLVEGEAGIGKTTLWLAVTTPEASSCSPISRVDKEEAESSLPGQEEAFRRGDSSMRHRRSQVRDANLLNRRARRRRILAASLLVAVPTVAAILFLSVGSAESALAASRCGPSQTGQAGLFGEAPVSIKPRSDDVTELRFGRSRSARFLDFRPELFGEAPPPGTAVTSAVRPFIRDDGATLAFGQVVITESEVSNNQQALVLTICVDPLFPEPADAGTYTGSVIIDDSGFNSAELPMTVMLQQVPVTYPLGFAFIGVVAGVLTQLVLLRLAEDTKVTRVSDGNVFQSHPVAAEVVTGIATAVVAAIPVYIGQYESNPAWAARPSEVFALASGAFAAAGAAYAATASLVRKTRPGARQPAGGAPSVPRGATRDG